VEKARGTKPRTLAWLAELAAREGPDAAVRAFGAIAPPEDVRPYAIVKSGRPALRTDVEKADGIDYESYNPPAWDLPYSLLRVRFEPLPKKDFIYHGGEELLVPLGGAVVYHFYWSPGGEPPRTVVAPPLRPGAIVRINPQLPHHTWAAGRAPAEAWMLFRHLSDTAAAISIDSALDDSPAHHPTPRRVARPDLADPGRYALIAWGLAERIRLARERANLRLAQLAHACEIDPSHLSRIENADTNVSLDTLVRIARVLRLGLADLVTPPARDREVAALPRRKGRSPERRPLLSPWPGHLLHVSLWDAPASSTADVAAATPPGARSSWILLEGRAVLEIPAPGAGGHELLEAGQAIHFRHGAAAKLLALQDTRAIHVVYSAACPCGA
jgi:transcriptional regulator with XRE-family HTH domain